MGSPQDFLDPWFSSPSQRFYGVAYGCSLISATEKSQVILIAGKSSEFFTLKPYFSAFFHQLEIVKFIIKIII